MEPCLAQCTSGTTHGPLDVLSLRDMLFNAFVVNCFKFLCVRMVALACILARYPYVDVAQASEPAESIIQIALTHECSHVCIREAKVGLALCNRAGRRGPTFAPHPELA